MEVKSPLRSPESKRRSGTISTFRSEELEYTSFQLLTTSQLNAKYLLEKPSAYYEAMEKQKFALITRATHTNKSSLSLAFCTALQRQSIFDQYQTLYNNKGGWSDHNVFKAAYSEISLQCLRAFTNCPNEITAEEKRRSIETLFSHVNQSKNFASKFLIAARLEALGAIEKAIIIYSHLIAKEFVAPAQFSNLIRIGTESSEALYQIGKNIIIKTIVDDKFRPALVHFIKTAIATLVPRTLPQDIHKHFSIFEEQEARTQSLIDIALACTELAVYNKNTTHAQAARFLSRCLMAGVQNYLVKNPQKACTILEQAYLRSAIRERELLIKQLIEFDKKLLKDYWVQATLANFYTLSIPVKDGIESLNDAQEALGYFKAVYDLISPKNKGTYGVDLSLISAIRRNSYQLALALLNIQSSLNEGSENSIQMLHQVEYLLYQSGLLGYPKSHCKLAMLMETHMDSGDNSNLIEAIDLHYRSALEAAMMRLSNQEYENILGQYREFVIRHLQMHTRLVDQYTRRLDDMRLNLHALDQLKKYNAAPTVGLFSSNTDKKDAKKQLEVLSEKSPLAIACLWSIITWSSTQNTLSDQLIDLLLYRGLCPITDPDFILKCINIFTDYYILAKQDPHATLFFTCLQKSILKTEQLDPDTRVAVCSIIDFYLNIINNKLEACKKPITAFTHYCISIFAVLEQRILLTPDAHRILKEFFDPKATIPVIFPTASPSSFQDGQIFDKIKPLQREQKASLLIGLERSHFPRDDSIYNNNETTSSSAPSTPTHEFGSRDRAESTVEKQPAKTKRMQLVRSASAPNLFLKKKTTSAPAILEKHWNTSSEPEGSTQEQSKLRAKVGRLA